MTRQKRCHHKRRWNQARRWRRRIAQTFQEALLMQGYPKARWAAYLKRANEIELRRMIAKKWNVTYDARSEAEKAADSERG